MLIFVKESAKVLCIACMWFIGLALMALCLGVMRDGFHTPSFRTIFIGAVGAALAGCLLWVTTLFKDLFWPPIVGTRPKPRIRACKRHSIIIACAETDYQNWWSIQHRRDLAGEHNDGRSVRPEPEHAAYFAANRVDTSQDPRIFAGDQADWDALTAECQVEWSDLAMPNVVEAIRRVTQIMSSGATYNDVVKEVLREQRREGLTLEQFRVMVGLDPVPVTAKS